MGLELCPNPNRSQQYERNTHSVQSKASSALNERGAFGVVGEEGLHIMLNKRLMLKEVSNCIQFYFYTAKTMKLSQGALQNAGPEPP